MGAMDIAGPSTSILGVVIGVSMTPLWESMISFAKGWMQHGFGESCLRADTIDPDVVLGVLRNAVISDKGVSSHTGKLASLHTSIA